MHLHVRKAQSEAPHDIARLDRVGNGATSHDAMVQATTPKAVAGDTTSIAARYARAKAEQEDRERGVRMVELGKDGKPKSAMVRLNERRKEKFGGEWWWVVGFFGWLL